MAPDAVVECLEQYKDEILDARCVRQLDFAAYQAMTDFRIDAIVAAACDRDARERCPAELAAPGDGRVVTCLLNETARVADAIARHHIPFIHSSRVFVRSLVLWV